MQDARGVDEQIQVGVLRLHMLRRSRDAGLIVRVQLHDCQTRGAVLPLQLLQLARGGGRAAGGHHRMVWPLQQLTGEL